MFSGRLKGVATGNFLNGVQFCESSLDLSYLPTALCMDEKFMSLMNSGFL